MSKTLWNIEAEDSQAFWERHYAAMTAPSSGRASLVLERFVAGRKPGRALELGCSRGDDAVWLAGRGWKVTAVDVSETALTAARASAKAAGVDDRIDFVRRDLGTSFPEGVFDLVSAMFLLSPVEFGRAQVLRRAATAVVPGGLLLIASHGSRAPWSSAPPNIEFPTGRDELAILELKPGGWSEVFVGEIEREGTGPGGQRAMVIDTVVALERL